MLLTQFWDTNPVTGPVDSWTVHGLWPDHCDGGFDANCDRSREYSNITAILRNFGKTDLLSYMQTYWPDWEGDDEQFWAHEWNKHGTCISTLEPECYNDHRATEEVVDYFQRTIDLNKALPSYRWLAEAGIVPSTSATYTAAQIQAALSSKRSGVTATLGCKNGALNEIWYHFSVRGSVANGEFVPSNPAGVKGDCAATGIKYLPKGNGAAPTSTTTTTATRTSSAAATGTAGAFSGKGYLNVKVGSATNGCVISAGTWYTTGSCATITATASGSGFTLSSSKGKCGVVSGAFVCGSSVSTATVFTAINGALAASGSTSWSADKVPTGSTQVSLYTGSGRAQAVTLVWQKI